MYQSDYYSINGGGPRLSPRKTFYICLSLFLGIWLVVLLIRGEGGDPRTSHQKIEEFRQHHHDEVHGHADMHHKEQPVSRRVVAPPEPLHPHPHPHPHDHDHEHEHDKEKPIEEKKNLVPFVATHEWQAVPENAVIPHGLEVRMNFDGLREARLHPNPPPDHLPEGSAAPLAPKVGADSGGNAAMPFKQERLIRAQKTAIEERLDEILSADPTQQKGALEWLDVEAHNLPIGSAICHARNFHNLFVLLESPQVELRHQAAMIIAASTHNNLSAAQAALSSELVARLVGRLAVEGESHIKRRIVAVLTYLAESQLSSTLQQFVSHKGFAVLEAVASKGMERSMFERVIVLLATLARDDQLDASAAAVAMLDKHLPKVAWQFDEMLLDALEPVCLSEAAKKSSSFPHLVAFCRKNLHN